MYTDRSLPLWYRTEYFHCPPICVLICSFLLSPELLATNHSSFYFSVVFIKLKKFFKILKITYLAVPGLSCGSWDLLIVPCPGIEPKPPALGAQSLSHWTAKEVAQHNVVKCVVQWHLVYSRWCSATTSA